MAAAPALPSPGHRSDPCSVLVKLFVVLRRETKARCREREREKGMEEKLFPGGASDCLAFPGWVASGRTQHFVLSAHSTD